MDFFFFFFLGKCRGKEEEHSEVKGFKIWEGILGRRRRKKGKDPADPGIPGGSGKIPEK